MATIDLEKLGREARASFSNRAGLDAAQLMIQLVQDYHSTDGDTFSVRLKKLLQLRRRGRTPSTPSDAFELLRHDASPLANVTSRQYSQLRLQALVEVIEEIRIEHGGAGAPSFYNDSKGFHDGPLIRLLIELFEYAGIPEDRRPGRHSMHNAIQKTRPKDIA